MWWRIGIIILGIILQALQADYDIENNSSSTADRIRAFFRRRKALKKCKKFLSVKKKIFILKNSNVMFTFDSVKKTMTCLNLKNYGQAVFVSWMHQNLYVFEYGKNNTFERVFDDICASFSETAGYAGILNTLKRNFDNVAEVDSKSSSNDAVVAINQNNLININDAGAEIIAKLPGINIVTAKKIVQRINSKGDYENIEQMFEEMKIKKHFKERLIHLICAKPAECKKEKSNDFIKRNNDFDDGDNRIVDF